LFDYESTLHFLSLEAKQEGFCIYDKALPQQATTNTNRNINPLSMFVQSLAPWYDPSQTNSQTEQDDMIMQLARSLGFGFADEEG